MYLGRVAIPYNEERIKGNMLFYYLVSCGSVRQKNPARRTSRMEESNDFSHWEDSSCRFMNRLAWKYAIYVRRDLDDAAYSYPLRARGISRDWIREESLLKIVHLGTIQCCWKALYIKIKNRGKKRKKNQKFLFYCNFSQSVKAFVDTL